MVNPNQLLLFYLKAALRRLEIYLLLFCAALVIAARQTPEEAQSHTAPIEKVLPLTVPEEKIRLPTAPLVKFSKTDSILLAARSLLGVPYRFGGKRPDGFDCSGFTRYVYRQVNLSIPASARSQFQQGVAVPMNQLQPGDLIFFKSQSRIAHVGIVINGGEGETCFIHASSSRGVVTDCLDDPYFGRRLAGTRRVLPS